MYQHPEKQNFRVLPEKANEKNSVYKLYEVRNFWAVSERNTAQTGLLQRGDVLASILAGLHPGRGKDEAPGTSGPNIHKELSLSQSLTSCCFMHSACLPARSTGTSFHGRQHNQWQFQGHSTTALQPKLRGGFISQLEIKNLSEALLLAQPES